MDLLKILIIIAACMVVFAGGLMILKGGFKESPPDHGQTTSIVFENYTAEPGELLIKYKDNVTWKEVNCRGNVTAGGGHGMNYSYTFRCNDCNCTKKISYFDEESWRV